MTKSFERVSVSSERVTKSFERVGVSSEWVTKSFERMQIFSNGLQTVVNGILLKNGKSLKYVFPCTVTNEKLELLIIGYNVIELTVKEDNNSDESLATSMTKGFRNSSPDSIPPLINLLQTNQPDELYNLSPEISKKPFVVPKGQTVQKPSRANTGPISRRIPVLFEPDELGHWTTGLMVHVHEALTTVNNGNTSIIDLQVTNNTDHNITLPGGTVLGRLQLVRSVTPVEVRLTNTEVTSVSLGEAYQVEQTMPSLVDH